MNLFCRDNSNSTVFHEYPMFWPISLQDASHYCIDTCTHLLQTALANVRSPFWLKTHADVCFDQNYFSVALKHYIEALVSGKLPHHSDYVLLVTDYEDLNEVFNCSQ